MSDWMAAEERTERMRSPGWFRRQTPNYDPTEHQPTPRDAAEVEPPLDKEND